MPYVTDEELGFRSRSSESQGGRYATDEELGFVTETLEDKLPPFTGKVPREVTFAELSELPPLPEGPSYVENFGRLFAENSAKVIGGFTQLFAKMDPADSGWNEIKREMNLRYNGKPLYEEKTPTEQIAPELRKMDFGGDENQLQKLTYEDLSAAPFSTVMRFAAEQGALSIPDMAAVMLSMPGYVGMRTLEIAEKRRENNGDAGEEPTFGDLLKSLPAATASALLEKFGTKGILGMDDIVKAWRDLPDAAFKAFVKEGVTEAAQNPIEYAGETLGTDAGFDPMQALRLFGEGIAAGGPFGAAVRTGTGAAQVVGSQRREKALAERIEELNGEFAAAARLDPSQAQAETVKRQVGEFNGRPVTEIGTQAPATQFVQPVPNARINTPAGAVNADDIIGAVPGERERARSTPTNLTPSDIASPIPNTVLSEGKAEVDDILAGFKADEHLSRAQLPRVGALVDLDHPSGKRLSGAIEDAGEDFARIRLDDGRRLRATFAELAGRITERAPPPPPTKAETAGAEMRAEADRGTIGQALATVKRSVVVEEAGHTADDPDPVAQDLLTRPKAIAGIDKVLAAVGITGVRPMAGGEHNVVLDAGNRVVRLGVGPLEERPKIPEVLQAETKGVIDGVRFEVLPKADTTNVTKEDVKTMEAALAKRGYKLTNGGTTGSGIVYGEDQFGRVGGKLMLLDAGAIRKMTAAEKAAYKEAEKTASAAAVAKVADDAAKAAPVTTATPDEVEAAAAEVDIEATDAQREAENHKMGHVKLAGLPVTIQVGRGQERTGKANGKAWSVKMPAHYGHIRGTEGADGDPIDVYIGPNPTSSKVFVVEQLDPESGQFDEHKVMLGFNDKESAQAAYQAAFSDGRGSDRMGNVLSMSMENFKKGLKANAYIKAKKKESVAASEPASPKKGAPKAKVERDHDGEVIKQAKPRKQRATRNVLEEIAAGGGVRDPGGEIRQILNGNGFVPGLGAVIRPDGHPLSYWAEKLVESGHVEPEEGGYLNKANHQGVLDAIEEAHTNTGQKGRTLDQQLEDEARAYEDRLADEERRIRDQIASVWREGTGEKPSKEDEQVVFELVTGKGMSVDEAIETHIERLAHQGPVETFHEKAPNDDTFDIPFETSEGAGQGLAGRADAEASTREGDEVREGAAQAGGKEEIIGFSKIRTAVDAADAALTGKVADALTKFVGHEPGARDATPGAVAVWHEGPLESIVRGEDKTADAMLKKAFAPVRALLASLHGKSVTLYRYQREIPAGSKQRFVLSWTADRKIAEAFADVTRELPSYAAEDIARFEKEIAATGKVKIGRHELRREPFGDDEILMIYDRDGQQVTDTDSVADYVADENRWAAEIAADNAPKRARVLTKSIPINDIVWVTDRAGQQEFIVKNDVTDGDFSLTAPAAPKMKIPPKASDPQMALGGDPRVANTPDAERMAHEAKQPLKGQKDQDFEGAGIFDTGARKQTDVVEESSKDSNKVFTKSAADAARERLRKKLNGSQLNSGLDPEAIQDAMTIAGYHIEKGARAFTAFSKAMVDDMGEAIRPYLRQLYEMVRYTPGFDAKGMSTAAEIDTAPALAPKPTPAPAPKAEASAAEKIAVAGIKVEKSKSKTGKDVWNVTGVSQVVHNMIATNDRKFGASYYNKGRAWSFWNGDPTEILASLVDGKMPGEKPVAPKVAVVHEPGSDAEFVASKGVTIEEVKAAGKTAWAVRGLPQAATDFISQRTKDLGASWYRGGNNWTFWNGDPTKAIATILKGGDPGKLKKVRKDGDDDTPDARKQELAKTRAEQDARPDERIAMGDVKTLVDEETKNLIRRGMKFGIPEQVVENQIEDVGLIVSARDRKKPIFVLANEAGTGKTFVLGGAIRELRVRGVKKFVYVTMNTDLIAQIQRDLKPYGVDDVQFVTYSALSTKSDVDTKGSVVIFDESHNVKNVDADADIPSKRGAAGQQIMHGAEFTIIASATPFENPVESRYMEGTGIFDEAGGHTQWAQAYGAAARTFTNQYSGKFEEVVKIYWPKRGKAKDGIDARQWFLKQGILTQRPMMIDPKMVDVTFHRSEVDAKYVEMYDRVTSAYDKAAEAFLDENGVPTDPKVYGEILRHRENTVKRILEASKIPFAIERARAKLATGKNVVIFVETKADRELGRWRRSAHLKDPTLYTYPQMVEMMAEWQMEAEMARAMDERAPPRPFAQFIFEIAGAFHQAGISYDLPSTSDEITEALKEHGVGVYTGAVTSAKATKNKTEFLAGKLKVLVATMAKGGTGLSLHDTKGNRPTSQININLPWKATGVDQVSGRVARYGLQSKAEIEWLFASNIPWESAKLAPKVGARMRDMGAVVKGILVKAAEKLDDQENGFDFEGTIDVKGAAETPVDENGAIEYSRVYHVWEIRRVERTKGGFREVVIGTVQAAAQPEAMLKALEKYGQGDLRAVMLATGAVPLDEDPESPKEEAKVGIGADFKRMVDLFGARMYAGNLVNITVKELVQNSFDSVKGAVAKGEIKKEDARIDISVNTENRMIQISDNGLGMTADTVRDAFLTIAGTLKDGLEESERSGGFGVAKLAFIFGSERIEVDTVRNGIRVKLSTNGNELFDGKAELVTESAHGVPNGTTVRAFLPASRENAKGELDTIYVNGSLTQWTYPFLIKPLIGDVKVTFRNEYVPEAKSIETYPRGSVRIGADAELTERTTRAVFPWGEIDIYISKKPGSAAGYEASAAVLSSGLYQFPVRIPFRSAYDDIPFGVILDVRPNVGADASNYPFNKQREGFNSSISKDVAAIFAYLKRIAVSQEAESVGVGFADVSFIQKDGTLRATKWDRLLPKKKSFVPEKTVKVEDGKMKNGMRTVLDANDKQADLDKQVDLSDFRFSDADISDDRPIFHSNLDVDVTEKTSNPEAARKLLGSIAQIVQQFRDGVGGVYAKYKRPGLLDQVPIGEETEKRPVGISLDKDYHGVHVKVPYKGFFLNPLSATQKSPAGLAASFVHTLKHELTHEVVSGHNESFTTEFARVDAELEDTNPGFQDLIQGQLQYLLTQNMAVFEELRSAFNAAANRGKGATEGASRQSTESDAGGASGRDGNGSRSAEVTPLTSTGGSGGSNRGTGGVGGGGGGGSVNPAPLSPRNPGAAQARQSLVGQILGAQPIDRVMRIPFDVFGGMTSLVEWKPGMFITKHAERIIVDAKFSDTGKFSWLNPTLERARMGLVDRYGLSDQYVERDRVRGIDERRILMQVPELMKLFQDKKIGPQEAKVLHAMMTGEHIVDADMAQLADPIIKNIDAMGAEAVALGLITPESYERNRGAYLHRVYMKHETNQSHIGKWVTDWMASRRKKLIGNQFKGRGMWNDVDVNVLMRRVPGFTEGARGAPVDGDQFRILDEMSDASQGQLPGVAQREGKVLKRYYLPADAPVPQEMSGLVDKGIWEVRGTRGRKVVLWRDFTKEERTKMGEIVDARYTISKTYMVMAHDLSTGRFYKDIAEHPDWTRTDEPENGMWRDASESFTARMLPDPTIRWIKVPTSKIPNSGTLKYGALAGRFVRAEIWRDINELEAMQKNGLWKALLTQWKLNKTARNPVVHMNNVMSNFVFMDMADVRAYDLARAVRSLVKQDDFYREAQEHGAFGNDMISMEIARDVLAPLLKEIQDDLTGTSTTMPFGILGKASSAIWGWAKTADDKMIQAYRLEDEMFRLATYIRRREQGMAPDQAAIDARDTFLNYDIRAPWVNAARRSVLPFIGYTYRAVPQIAKNIAHRPWKLAKLALILYVANHLGYMLVGEDDDDEEEQRRSMIDSERGRTWVGGHRMMRLPWNDENGNAVFLDVRRWVPAGDVFDAQQGAGAFPLPPWMQIGGPLVIAGELAFNRNAFTGDEITNEYTDGWWDKTAKIGDHAWKQWMPAAAWVPGSWYWEKIGRAIGDGTDAYGNDYSVPQALASSVGVKLKPQDTQAGFANWAREFERVERALRQEMTNAGRQRSRGLLSEAAYQRKISALMEKFQDLGERRQETFTPNR